MKKFLRNKLLFGVVISVLAMAAFSGIVYAATMSVSVPGSVNVVAASNDIKLFSDPDCKYALKSLAWDDLPVGGERTKHVYILNVGNTDAEVTATLSGAPAGISLNAGSSTITVTAGQSSQFTLYLEAEQTAPQAAASFTVTFTSNPAYVNTTTTTTTP